MHHDLGLLCLKTDCPRYSASVLTVVTRCLKDANAFLQRRTAVALIVRRVDAGKKGDVYTESPVLALALL